MRANKRELQRRLQRQQLVLVAQQHNGLGGRTQESALEQSVDILGAEVIDIQLRSEDRAYRA